MSSEMSIIMLSVNLVAYLDVRAVRKLAIVACFAPRAFVLVASLLRLIWLYPITPHGDPEYDLWVPLIITQVHVSISICTACIPYLAPIFKALESSLRKNSPYNCRRFRMAERRDQDLSSLWYRRHKKAETCKSWDSTAVASVQYVRVPQISPYIPTPRPMSPLTPLRFYTPPNSAASRSRYSSPDGLCISIPDRRTDIPGPQTASSFALSPSCASPFPLLSVSTLVSTHNAPTPPQKAHPPSPASGYSSRSPSPVRQVRQARFSLFPHQAVQPNYPSPNIPKSGVNSVSVPPIRAMRSQTLNGTSRHSAGLRPPYSAEIIGYPKRSSSTVLPKFGTAPQPTSPPPTKTTLGSRCKYSTSHEPDSPMGTAIHNYFESNVPQAAPSRPLPALPSNAHRQRNQRVLSPSNTLRTNQSPSKAQRPAPTPPYVSRVGFLSPRDSMLTTRTARSKPLPHIRDARSSPKMVVRDLA
jgi:hypothetical protein